MSCTDFPSTGLIPNVTTHSVGSITYVWTGEVWESQINVPTDESRVIPFSTLDEAINSTDISKIFAGAALNLKERSTGNGGGAMWDVVDASTVTPNTYNIVQCVGVASLALVLRVVANINIRQFGAVGLVGVDDYLPIKAAIETGQNILIPQGTFEISGWLPVLSNQVIKFEGWLKIVNGVNFYEAVLTMSNTLNGFSTDNATIINPQIDCNNHSSANGIIIRDGTTNCRVSGGRIKNAKHGRSDAPVGLNYGGGRAINIEAGSGGLSIPSNNNVTGLVIENAYNAISVAGNGDSPEKNNSIANIIAYNCEVLIHLPGNGPTFPHTVNTAGCLISNIQGFNVGKAETYTRKHGIISGDRGANAHINGVKVQNEASYTSAGLGVGSVTMGEMANIVIDSCEVTSDLTDIVNINSYAEKDGLPTNRFGSRGLRFNIKHRGTTTNTVNYAFSYNPSLSGGLNDANPYNNIFEIDTTLVSTGLPLPATVATYPQIYIKAYEETNNAFWEGFAELLQSEQFSNFANSRFFGAPITVSDGAGDRSGGMTIRSFAPVLKYKDLTGSAHFWETYVDSNQFHMGISTDQGANWNEYFTYAPNYFKAFNTNSADLGENGASSWRNIYSQNAVTVTSDARLKPIQESINQELLDFALSVEVKQYTLADENPTDDFNEVQPYHYGVVIDDEFIASLSKVVDIDACSAFCHTLFTNKNGESITVNRGGIELGDVWQVRYDEWQNIIIEAMRRKLNSL